MIVLFETSGAEYGQKAQKELRFGKTYRKASNRYSPSTVWAKSHRTMLRTQAKKALTRARVFRNISKVKESVDPEERQLRLAKVRKVSKRAWGGVDAADDHAKTLHGRLRWSEPTKYHKGEYQRKFKKYTSVVAARDKLFLRGQHASAIARHYAPEHPTANPPLVKHWSRDELKRIHGVKARLRRQSQKESVDPEERNLRLRKLSVGGRRLRRAVDLANQARSKADKAQDWEKSKSINKKAQHLDSKQFRTMALVRAYKPGVFWKRKAVEKRAAKYARTAMRKTAMRKESVDPEDRALRLAKVRKVSTRAQRGANMAKAHGAYSKFLNYRDKSVRADAIAKAHRHPDSDPFASSSKPSYKVLARLRRQSQKESVTLDDFMVRTPGKAGGVCRWFESGKPIKVWVFEQVNPVYRRRRLAGVARAERKHRKLSKDWEKTYAKIDKTVDKQHHRFHKAKKAAGGKLDPASQHLANVHMQKHYNRLGNAEDKILYHTKKIGKAYGIRTGRIDKPGVGRKLHTTKHRDRPQNPLRKNRKF